MSFNLRYTQTLSSAGTEIISQDITGSIASDAYGQNGNLAVADVTATYTKIARLTDINNVTTLEADESFIARREYIKTAGTTSSIEDKVFSVGDKFIPRNGTFVVPSGDTWQTTGYVYVPSDYLPSDTAPQYISIENFNQIGSYIADDLYITDYSVFYDGGATYPNIQAINSGSSANAYDGMFYFVTGGRVEYNGSRYYPGDTFVGIDENTITPQSGSVIWGKYASTVYYEPLLYTIVNNFYSLINAAMAQNIYGYQDLNKQILSARIIMEALDYAAYTNNVSFTQTEDNISYLNTQINILMNEIGI